MAAAAGRGRRKGGGEGAVGLTLLVCIYFVVFYSGILLPKENGYGEPS